MRKNLILIVVVMLMAVPAYAHLYDNDFETQTVGANVADPAEKYNGWNWWGPSSVGEFAVDPLDAGNTVVDTVGGQSALHIDGYPLDNLTEVHLNIEFDIYQEDLSRWDIYMIDNNTSDVVAPAFNASGASTVRYKVDDGVNPAVLTVVPVPGLVAGTWVHASMQIDQLGERWSFNVAGTQVALNAQFIKPNGNGGNWAVNIDRMVFEAAAGNVLIDNITITEIPEPATMSLLGLGGLLLRRKRK
jgi:hypothetical protein